jgi:hypothetical protein
LQGGGALQATIPLDKSKSILYHSTSATPINKNSINKNKNLTIFFKYDTSVSVLKLFPQWQWLKSNSA